MFLVEYDRNELKENINEINYIYLNILDNLNKQEDLKALIKLISSLYKQVGKTKKVLVPPKKREKTNENNIMDIETIVDIDKLHEEVMNKVKIENNVKVLSKIKNLLNSQ